MPQLIALDYTVRTNPVAAAFGEALAAGRITGHRCPSCGLVFVPPKGFCPICVVPTGPADEVEVADRGIVTSWTVLTPIQYAGQQERSDYALASILLEGASGTIGQQRLLEVALDEIRMGLRVEAVWAPDRTSAAPTTGATASATPSRAGVPPASPTPRRPTTRSTPCERAPTVLDPEGAQR